MRIRKRARNAFLAKERSKQKHFIPCLFIHATRVSRWAGIYFHGNGEDVNSSIDFLRVVRRNLKVLLLIIVFSYLVRSISLLWNILDMVSTRDLLLARSSLKTLKPFTTIFTMNSTSHRIKYSCLEEVLAVGLLYGWPLRKKLELLC